MTDLTSSTRNSGSWLNDETFDFDLESPLGDLNSPEDEVFIGPITHREKCIAVVVKEKEEEKIIDHITPEEQVMLLRESTLISLKMKANMIKNYMNKNKHLTNDKSDPDFESKITITAKNMMNEDNFSLANVIMPVPFTNREIDNEMELHDSGPSFDILQRAENQTVEVNSQIKEPASVETNYSLSKTEVENTTKKTKRKSCLPVIANKSVNSIHTRNSKLGTTKKKPKSEPRVAKEELAPVIDKHRIVHASTDENTESKSKSKTSHRRSSSMKCEPSKITAKHVKKVVSTQIVETPLSSRKSICSRQLVSREKRGVVTKSKSNSTGGKKNEVRKSICNTKRRISQPSLKRDRHTPATIGEGEDKSPSGNVNETPLSTHAQTEIRKIALASSAYLNRTPNKRIDESNLILNTIISPLIEFDDL